MAPPCSRISHRHAHFVDGGITDHLGLRAMLEAVEVLGGARDQLRTLQIQSPRRIAVISVNAAAGTRQGIDDSVQQPTIEQTLNAVTNVQLYRYNTDTLQDMQQGLARWTQQLSTPQRPVDAFFICLSFEDVPDLPLRRYLNETPTCLALSTEQVDELIAAGRALLRTNAEFRRLVASLDGRLATVPVTSR